MLNYLLQRQFREEFEGLEFSAVRWQDYDQDGDPDLFLSGATDAGRLAEIYQNVDGDFVESSSAFTAVSKSAAAWGDYDKDGDMDLFVTGQISNTDRVAKLYNNLLVTPNSSIQSLTSDEHIAEVPQTISLSTHPNPFNPTTEISYSLSKPSEVRLRVFDITGRQVGSLVNKFQEAGQHSARFDASHLASGVYLTVLETTHQVMTQKIVLIK